MALPHTPVGAACLWDGLPAVVTFRSSRFWWRRTCCQIEVIAWRSGHLDIGFVRLSRMKIHDVPYRAIVPEKLDGLLMAGRCISATHVAASAGKSMGNCVATGHAAGIAAAMAASKQTVPRELDVARIQQALRDDGVDLDRGGEDQSSWLSDGRTPLTGDWPAVIPRRLATITRRNAGA